MGLLKYRGCVYAVAGLMVASGSFFSAGIVFAHNDGTEAHSSTHSESDQNTSKKSEELLKQKKEELEKAQANRKEAEKQRQDERAQKAEKLDAKRLELCEKKESIISENMTKIISARSKQLETMNSISSRTQDFYKERSLVIENYDELSANVSAKRAVAEKALSDLKGVSVDFKCDQDDPLRVPEVFMGARKEVYVSYKEYKVAIKELIVAVKQSSKNNDAKESQ